MYEFGNLYTQLEDQALFCLRNVDRTSGTIDDYRRILRPVDQAQAAMKRAHIAMHDAIDTLSMIRNNQ